jgi:8-oxo-dGTP pyrophosphatase MutT (NUDIX family)
MEMVEHIDWDGNVVAIRPMSDLKKEMFPHKASLVIPRGINGGFIISKRAMSKDPYPGTWMCAIGGKVSAGESFEVGAQRESLEEAKFEGELVAVTTFAHKEGYTALFKVFTTKNSVDINNLEADLSEIDCFKEISEKDLREEVKKNPESFAPTFLAALEQFLAFL